MDPSKLDELYDNLPLVNHFYKEINVVGHEDYEYNGAYIY